MSLMTTTFLPLTDLRMIVFGKNFFSPHTSTLTQCMNLMNHLNTNEFAQHAIAMKADEFGSMHFAGGAFNYTAECQTLRGTVRFFHEAWGHLLRDLMCKIVVQKMLASILADLTVKTIRKRFL